jgi:hypothetical protein
MNWRHRDVGLETENQIRITVLGGERQVDGRLQLLLVMLVMVLVS